MAGSEIGHILNESRLHVVMWSADGKSWGIVADEGVHARSGERTYVPSAHKTLAEAEDRAVWMIDQFPDSFYKVVSFDAAGA